MACSQIQQYMSALPPGPKILIVDDEQPIRYLLADNLSREGYTVAEAADGREALEMFARHTPDLVVLDVSMPEMSGWEVLKTIRERSEVPVLMLTARSTEADELTSFGLGADDYVTKPFSIRQVLARIQAVLRRVSRSTENQIIAIGPLMINLSTYSVLVDNHPVILTRQELALLEVLARNPGRPFSRAELLARCWETGYQGIDRVVDVHMVSLRRKLNRSRQLIKTVYGVGYKLNL